MIITLLINYADVNLLSLELYSYNVRSTHSVTHTYNVTTVALATFIPAGLVRVSIDMVQML